MPRPRLHTRDRRLVVITIRLSSAEAKRLEKLAHDYHFRDEGDGTISNTVRRALNLAFDAYKAKRLQKVAKTLDEP